jgi:probable phosphoglycerate mutase
MLLYAVRHAQSLANAEASRRLNSPLSSLGGRQAEALASRLGGLPIAAVYSSPFERCLRTAEPVARRLGLPIWLRPELCEYHHLPPGSIADTMLPTPEEIVRSHAGTLPDPGCPRPLAWPPVDEPFESLLHRTRVLAADLKARWPGRLDTILLISHGSPIARLIEAWLTDLPGPSFRFVIDNAALTALRYDEGVSSLVCLNETSHLRGLEAPETANYNDDGSIRPVAAGGCW